MKVLFFNESDALGGASRASYRLCEGLRGLGVDSRFLVQRECAGLDLTEPPHTAVSRALGRLRPYLDAIPRKMYPNRDNTIFFPARLPDSMGKRVAAHAPALVHMHWIINGMIRIETLTALGVPLIWTLHDMWAFTGGCTYSGDCLRFREGCGNCPVLGSSSQRDLSWRTWERKRRAWKQLPLVVVTPSRWMARMAASSPILEGKRIEVIPNGLDLDLFRPVDKYAARNRFSLPHDRRIVLFGAMHSTDDPRKGYQQLIEALSKLPSYLGSEDVVLAVFGSDGPEADSFFPFESRYLGIVKEEEDLACLYSASDLFVAPSLEDNLPNTVMEALACGTPCVAFNIGGIPDMIEHGENGYLAAPGDADALAKGIAWILTDEERSRQLSFRARSLVEDRFELRSVASRYLDLYREMTESTFGKNKGSSI